MSPDERFAKEYRELRIDPVAGYSSDVVTGPVTDWTADFSDLDPRWAADAPAIWDDLRQTCPIAHTDRFGGAWLPTRYDDVAEIAYDTEHFSSRAIVMSNFRPSHDIAPVGGTPPISSDPPFHHDARKLLLPAFTRAAVGTQEEATRAFCDSLLDGFAGRDVVDAAAEYAQHIPMRGMADMLGFPREDEAEFARFVENALVAVNLPAEERLERSAQLFDYLFEQIRDHLARPRGDLTGYLINAELYGRRLDPTHVAGMMALLLIAGIDTTWSAIGAALWHLATHADDRRRLAAEPTLLPTAIEELLRAYAPVTMARLVKDDMHWHGAQMKADDWILLSFPAANRDPAQFEQAGEVILDRRVNRHAAFGLGIHRCVGSHLARMELRVALEAWMARLPEFTLDDPDAVTWSVGQIRGPRTLALRIG